MKKYFTLVMMAVMALGFATVSTSCSSDDDDNASSASKTEVVGNWGVVLKTAETGDVEWAGEMNFMANGTMSIKTEDASFGNWTMKGNSLEISGGTEKILATVKYSDDTTMLLSYTQDGENYTMLMKRMEYSATVKNLAGTWKVDEVTVVNPEDSDLEIEFDDIIINADGTCMSDNVPCKWQLNGNTITFTSADGTVTGIVKDYKTIEMTIELDIEGTKVIVPMLRIA